MHQSKEGDAIKDSYTPKIGEVIDRYGSPKGRYTSPVKNGKIFSYNQRSLLYVEDPSQYHQYEVIGDFSKLKNYSLKCSDSKLRAKIDAYILRYYNEDFKKVKTYTGKIAAGFGAIGGGEQFELPILVEWLEKLGILKEIK